MNRVFPGLGGGIIAAVVMLSTIGTVNANVNHNIEGSIRGRVGYAWDRVLIYATGGVAFGGFNGNVSGNFPGGIYLNYPVVTAFGPFGGSTSASPRPSSTLCSASPPASTGSRAR